MPLWLWILFFAALIKIPLAGLMLWIPYRFDESQNVSNDLPDSSEEDGGSKALPASPLDPRPRAPHPRGPRPRSPRRGPHGSPTPPPRRIRTSARPARALRVR